MWYALIGLGLVALSCLLIATHRHDRQVTRELEASHVTVDELRRICADDVALLGTDVQRHAPLDDLGEMTDEAWRNARDLQAKAEELLEHATGTLQFGQVTTLVAAGRRSLAEVQALVLDDEAPEPRPCCFFNPNHGPSDASVEWSTPSGTVLLPCCLADARRVESGAEPYSRTWRIDGERRPWWEAGEAAGPWARGWFSEWRGSAEWDAIQAVVTAHEPDEQSRSVA